MFRWHTARAVIDACFGTPWLDGASVDTSRRSAAADRAGMARSGSCPGDVDARLRSSYQRGEQSGRFWKCGGRTARFNPRSFRLRSAVYHVFGPCEAGGRLLLILAHRVSTRLLRRPPADHRRIARGNGRRRCTSHHLRSSSSRPHIDNRTDPTSSNTQCRPADAVLLRAAIYHAWRCCTPSSGGVWRLGTRGGARIVRCPSLQQQRAAGGTSSDSLPGAFLRRPSPLTER